MPALSKPSWEAPGFLGLQGMFKQPHASGSRVKARPRALELLRTSVMGWGCPEMLLPCMGLSWSKSSCFQVHPAQPCKAGSGAQDQSLGCPDSQMGWGKGGMLARAWRRNHPPRRLKS